jgi:molecular chaperone HscC
LVNPIIGIDLGTTNSLVGAFVDGRPRLLPNAHGGLLTPSVVGVLPSGEVIVGAAAREQRVTDPHATASCFKRYMGSDRKLDLGGRTFSAPELSSLVLGSLKGDAEIALCTPVSRAVVTVPAYFNDHQRQATRLAGRLAGLDVLRILNEPTAAALTYGFHDRRGDKRILVVDLGGGTFDVTLMQVFEGSIEIVATAGEAFLGGEDFTNLLVARVLESQGLQYEASEISSPHRVSRLRKVCEDAKRSLGAGEPVVIRMPDARGDLGEDAPGVRVTPGEYASLCEKLLARLAAPVAKVLRDGRSEPGEVDDLVLVGGALRMPLVRKFFEARLQREGLMTHDPDHAVGLGAAVQAGLLARESGVEDMMVTDVCPFTLGMEIVKKIGREHVDGFFLPIIHRNTTVPVSQIEEVFTTHANQTQVVIEVYQGDARRVKDNLHLGSLKVTGIPRGPSGTPIHVRFTYDLNGLLEVEVLVPSTGRKFTGVFTNHVKGLRNDAIREAVAKMQALKVYPREDLGSRRLLLFGERVLGEVPFFQRAELDDALTEFEAAMQSGDRKSFDAARELLLILLDRLGHPFEGREDADQAGAS